MDNKLKEQLQEVISKHMPGLVAGEMKEFIEKAEQAIRENTELKKENLEYAKQVQEQKEQLNNFKSREQTIQSMESELKTELAKVDEKDKNLELTMINFRNEQLSERIKDMKEVVLTLVKNPRAIEFMSTVHNETIPTRNQYGGVYYDNKSTSSNGQKEKTETKD